MHYTGTIWRPPYEASSLLLEVAAGCTHHSCKFCTLYADLPFHFKMSPLTDIEADLKEAKAHMKRWKNSGISRTFLTGANPFVLNFSRLMEIADLIKKHVPSNQTIGCFSRITDVSLKTDEELSALAAAGFDLLTIGIETGDDEALEFMHKGYFSKDILAQCIRLDQAGIGYNFFYLTGISGMGKGEQGARATARIRDIKNKEVWQLRKLRAMGVNGLSIGTESGDDDTLLLANKGYTSQDILEQCRKLDEAGIEYYFVYMTGLAGKGAGYRNAINSAKIFSQLNPYFISVDSLTLFSDTKLYDKAKSGEFIPAGEKERIRELQAFIQNLRIRTHLFANSKSNFYPIAAYLPKERNSAIRELQYVIDTVDEQEMNAYRNRLQSLE